HLTCVNCTKEDIDIILTQLKENGIENILALRGDINPDIPPKHDFKYASELVTYIKQRGDFSVSGACYPEGHVDSDSIIEDITHLKEKVDAGAEHLMSQLFFDNAHFYDFLEKARTAGINVPIEAGIMPVTNKKSIERMVSLCGASLPSKFTKMMQKYENNPEALRDAGIAYAIDQIVDLISNGVDGIHLYTMNNPYVARKISESISNLL
ncbi:MAG: methylenetetrahydrofolate reductase, partial [Lachnospiraceae bacterium]|nr:methylenetetrahydrofolate reductase [Lachnospiraceae bacterium]